MIKQLGWAIALAACGARQAPVSNTTGDAVTVAWIATQAEGEDVDVSIVVDGTPHALGTLNAAADDERGTPATCESEAGVRARFWCGATPAYNGFGIKLDGKTLVVSRETSVHDGEKTHDEESHEVKRIAVTGKRLAITPFVPPPSPPKE
jgi:hypothetical protein